MTDNADIPVRVVLGAQSLQAEIIVPPIAEAERLTVDACVEALEAGEVRVTEDVRRRLAEALAGLEIGKELRAVVAEAQPPCHGLHGRIEWHVGPEAGITAPARSADETDDPEAPAPDESGRIDHYARTTYSMVSAGQVLGQIVPPAEPVDGCDVRGRPIRAKPGRPARLRHDESIEIDESGRILARADGVLTTTLGKWSVRDYLQIPGYVDFSTGNIDFIGNIEVIRGVRDCFTVSADGNLEVRGLVEAAHLRTGGDLLAHGGVAARERGSLLVQGDLVAKYLDAAGAEVGGSLRVAREIINCSIVVHADVESPSATIIGGTLTPTGRVRVATIGSPAGVRTRLVLNTVPRLEPKLAESERLITQLATQMEALAAGSPERARAGERLSKLERARDHLRETVESLRTVDLWVSLMVHHGVQLIVDRRVWELREDLAGPVTIRLARDGALHYRLGKEGESRPLLDLCDPDLKTAA